MKKQESPGFSRGEQVKVAPESFVPLRRVAGINGEPITEEDQ